MAHILDKIKTIDLSKISDDKLKSQIDGALGEYDNKDELTETEINLYESLYDKAQNHIDESEKAALKAVSDAQEKADADAKLKKEEEDKEKDEATAKAEKEDADAKEKLAAEEKETADATAKADKDAASQAVKDTPWPHEDLMKELGYARKDLPENIRNKFKGFKMALGKLVADPTNERKLNSVERISNETVDMINAYKDKKMENPEDGEAAPGADDPIVDPNIDPAKKAEQEKIKAEMEKKKNPPKEETPPAEPEGIGSINGLLDF